MLRTYIDRILENPLTLIRNIGVVILLTSPVIAIVETLSDYRTTSLFTGLDYKIYYFWSSVLYTARWGILIVLIAEIAKQVRNRE